MIVLLKHMKHACAPAFTLAYTHMKSEAQTVHPFSALNAGMPITRSMGTQGKDS